MENKKNYCVNYIDYDLIISKVEYFENLKESLDYANTLYFDYDSIKIYKSNKLIKIVK